MSMSSKGVVQVTTTRVTQVEGVVTEEESVGSGE